MKKKKYILINVNSRKGGVGKTTVALYLARTLISNFKKSKVVVLDLDISGTNLTDACDALKKSPVWENYIEPLTLGKENINLVTLFDNYMNGKDITGCSWESSDSKKIHLKESKINIFGSSLPEFVPESACKGKSKTYPSALLFSPIYAKWFVGMLRELIEDIDSAPTSAGGQTPLIVILDNAPGNYGFAHELENWGTDLGPVRGKFVFVSTPDCQDTIAINNAMCKVYQSFSEKLQGGKEYHRLKEEDAQSSSVKNDNSSIEENDMAEKFLARLIETMPDNDCKKESTYCTECELCFYRHKQALFKTDSYIACIFNKVPRNTITFLAENFKANTSASEEIKNIIINSAAAENFINYSEAIALQYSAEKIKIVKPKLSKEEKDKFRSTEKFIGWNSAYTLEPYFQLRKAFNSPDKNGFLTLLIKHAKSIIKGIQIHNTTIINLIFERDIGNISPLWDDEFLLFPIKEHDSNISARGLSEQSWQYYNRINDMLESIKKNKCTLQIELLVPLPEPLIDIIPFVLASVCIVACQNKLDNPQEIFNLLNKLIDKLLSHLLKDIELQRHLETDFYTSSYWLEHTRNIRLQEILDGEEDAHLKEEINFFFKLFPRLIDSKNDARFLVKCVEAAVYLGENQGMIKEIADDVIVKKLKSHDDGLVSLKRLGFIDDNIIINEDENADYKKEYLKMKSYKEFENPITKTIKNLCQL